MVLYIEYVLFDNIIIDYCLIKLLERTFKDKYKKIFVILSLSVGVLGAIFLPFLIGNTILSIVYRLVLAVTMVLLLKKYNSIKAMTTRFVCFIGYTALIAGVIIGVLNLLNIPYTISGVLLYGLEMPMGALILIVVIGITILDKFIKVMVRVISNSKYMCDMTIEDKGVVIDIKGFYDSGNMVAIDGEYVSIISMESFLKLHKDMSIIDLLKRSKEMKGLDKIKYVDISGVSSSQNLLSFVVDKIVLNGREYYGQRIAVAHKNFDEFDCILSSNYLGVIK